MAKQADVLAGWVVPMKNDIFLISGDTFGINNVNVMVIVMVIVIVTVTVMYRWQ